MRSILSLLGLVLLIFLATLTFFLFSFHPDRYRGEILEQLNSNPEIQISYRKSAWNIFEPLTLQLSDLDLNYAQAAKVRAAQVRVNLGITQLLQGTMDVKHVYLDKVNVEIDASALKESEQTGSTSQSIDWVDQLNISKILLSDAKIHYKDEHNDLRLQKLELSIEDLEIPTQHFSDPLMWRFSLHANAGYLNSNHVDMKLPQISFQWLQGKLELEHFGADIFQGRVRAQASFSNGNLRISQFSLENANLEYYVPYIEQAVTSTATNPVPWLTRIEIDEALVSQINTVIGYNQQLFSADKLSAEISQASMAWPLDPSDLKLEFAIISDQLVLDNNQLEKVSANGLFEQGVLRLTALDGNWNKGKVQLSASYQPPPHNALTVHELSLSGNEIPILPEWFESSADSSLPLTYLFLQQARIKGVKVLSYVDSLPLSAQGLDLDLDTITIIKDGQLQDWQQMWQTQTKVFMELPEFAYRGLVLSQLSADIGTKTDVSFANLYAELPLGQIELQVKVMLEQQGLPWQAELKGLLLDISPLARISGSSGFQIAGDMELSGNARGLWHKIPESVDGSLTLSSQKITLNNIDLNQYFEHLIEDPDKSFIDYQKPLAQGMSALWKSYEALPSGDSQFNNLQLQASIEEGLLRIPEQNLLTQPYSLALSGQFDLSSNSYDGWRLSVKDGDCWKIQRTLEGDFSEPEVIIDHFLKDRSYFPKLNTFLVNPNRPSPCRPAFRPS
ncbi:hypothetical protein DBZ36_19690 [Alginatibacterium sediminis]|uniref:AsmA domain-containing protein n=1 Tax=Alginatibacterium sediminis TaxID=2164068 RepID=A0A420E5Z5_9ALTE|nr:AsmA-like C-terminal region-containing protein [Alginatibacterium sediminis]RKF13282.1 hypothetical protein DBZ36_19690 [Alginatibacterium sediminis]